MPTPTLYGCFRSRALRPLWLAEEAGIGLDLVTVFQAQRLRDPEAEGAPLNTRSDALLRLNPMGGIPVLTEALAGGELVLAESMAILLYLARRAGDLGPRDDAEAAEMAQWAFMAASSVEEAALDLSGAANSDDPEDAAIVEDAMARLERPLAVLEGRLANQPFMVGDRFTAADVAMAEVIRFVQAHQPAMAMHPALDAWLRGCQARPAFLRVWERREAEPWQQG